MPVQGGGGTLAYAIRYRKRAKIALDNCCQIYGPSLAEPLHRWLAHLAAEAQGRKYSISLDGKTFFETIANNPDPEKWIGTGRRWLDASAVAKIKAIGVLLTKRCPPWEFRAALKTFRFLGQCTYEVMAFYEVDHVEKRIVITTFDVPGPLGP
jgi:hypothetical protein